jgi:spore germination protein YaaH
MRSRQRSLPSPWPILRGDRSVKRRQTVALLSAALLLAQAAAPLETMAADPLPDGSVVTQNGRVLPPMPYGLVQASVQAEMLADHAGDRLSFEPGGEPTVLLSDGKASLASGSAAPSGLLATPYTAAALPNGLRKEVLGFLPYWLLNDTALGYLNYNLVSTIAYFSVGSDKYGNLVKGTSTGWTGWTSSRMTQVLDRAHSNGVRVVLTVTMMAWDSASSANMATLLGTSANRSRLVAQIVDAVRSRGADGVNLDFEPVASSLGDEYLAFVRQLKAALVSGGAGSYLTVCVMAGAATWATGYDVAGLTASGGADHLFVMGYDYNWSGSSRAGGVAPIRSPYTLDVSGTMNDFLAETSGSKIIWGVPYYGRTWPTSSSQLNATTLGGGSKAYTYTGHLSEARQYGRLWDDVGKVPWYRYYDNAAGHWVQGYYDDAQSLGIKYDLVNGRGLAGTGMWTLLMDQGTNDLWRLLADKFVTDTAPPVGGIALLPESVDAQAVQVEWNAIDYASGIDRYNVQARPIGGAWDTWLAGTGATSGWFGGDAGTSYEFRVQAIDLKGNAQPWVSVPAKPAALAASAFARVSTEALNVRSGAGTSYGIVDSLSLDDVVYVLSGPEAASGYDWYRVQYGFAEWPAAGYAQIGWVAAGDGSEAFLMAAAAPTITRLDPFVSALRVPPQFIPNGDGRDDTVTATFDLRAAAAVARLEVVSSAGGVVRTVDLGALPPGPNTATWDGRITSGARAPEGRYLLRIVAEDGGGTAHYGPAAGFGAGLLDGFGTRLRLSPFDDIATSPFKADIEWLYAQDVTRGCSPTTYCPGDPVAREQMASFIVRAMDLAPSSTDFFTDDEASQHESDINALAGAGITAGCGTRRFCPTVAVSREQMASFLARALHLSPATVDYFDDDDGSAHEADINRVAAAGITAGCAERRFCGGSVVTREQMAAFLRRALAA